MSTSCRKKGPIYKSARERLHILKADTGEEMHDRLSGSLSFYFANPTDFAPEMLEIMLNMPCSRALNHRRATRERPTYPFDDMGKVEAQTLIVVGREDPV